MRWKPGTHGHAAEEQPAEWSPGRGTQVTLRNILGRKHLNGSVGVVVERADNALVERESRRCRVRLQETGFIVRVRPENLEPCEPAPAPRRHAATSTAEAALLTGRVELPSHIALTSDVPPRATGGVRRPSRPRSEVPRAITARGEQPCGEVYAAIQKTAAGRDPLRLRHLGGSFFRDKPGDGHPLGCSAVGRRFPQQALSARDWRARRQRAGGTRADAYATVQGIPWELGGLAESPRPARLGSAWAPAAVEDGCQTEAVQGADTFQLHPVLRQRLSDGSGSAWSRLRSGLDLAIPLDPGLRGLLLREDVAATTRAVAAGAVASRPAPRRDDGKCSGVTWLRATSEPITTTFMPLGALSAELSMSVTDDGISDPGVLATCGAVGGDFEPFEVDGAPGRTPDLLHPGARSDSAASQFASDPCADSPPQSVL